MPRSSIGRRVLTHAAGWALFALMLAFGWRVTDLAQNVPNYDDVLEALWGIDLYYEHIVGRGIFPAFVPSLWHPYGLHLGSLGVTPAVFLLSVPLRAGFGSAVLAYNCMAVGALTVSFAAAQRCAREVLPAQQAYLAALLFAFSPFHWERLNGHINVNLGLAVLPLAVLFALRWVRTQPKTEARAALCMGVCWGITASLQLYGVWWGLLLWLCVLLVRGRQSNRWTAILPPLVALAIAAPTLAYFFAGSRAMDQITDRMPALVGWGSSLNSLLIPSGVHPLAPVREFSRWLYHGIQNESGSANWGFALPLCALAGIVVSLRRRAGANAAAVDLPRPVARMLELCAITGLLLSLGYVAKWHGDALQTDAFVAVNRVLWHAGRAAKPGLFDVPEPPAALERAVPLPAYLLLIAVPGWESARVLPRFGFVASLALALLAAAFVRRLPRPLAVIVAGLLLVEVLPAPTRDLRAPQAAHPAYAWARAQPEEAPGGVDWNILDITDEPKVTPLVVGGAVAYAQRLHGLPLASGLSSFLPRQVDVLAQRLSNAPEWTQDAGLTRMLAANRTRYVFVHRLFGWDTRVWDGLSSSPHFVARGCFEGLPGQVFPNTICVAEISGR